MIHIEFEKSVRKSAFVTGRKPDGASSESESEAEDGAGKSPGKKVKFARRKICFLFIMSQQHTVLCTTVEMLSSLCGPCDFWCILSHQTFLSPQKQYGKNLSVRPTKTIGDTGQLVDGARKEDKNVLNDIQAYNRFLLRQKIVSLGS